MSKISASAKEIREKEVKKPETNFMNGTSYGLTRLETLKAVTASSIFGEPQYYRNGAFAEKGALRDKAYSVHKLFSEYSVLDDSAFSGKNTSEIMERVIDDALDEDFEATIRWAAVLRTEYMMRLNPQVIMVRAAMHPKRAEFTAKNPSVFSEINQTVMGRLDEPASQLAYYIYKNGSKKNLPNVLKKDWKRKLENASKYTLNKYKSTGLGIIDTVRVCHANSGVLNELMRTGTLEVSDSQKTWESLKSGGKSWVEILDSIRLPHMALLRNLRGIFTEIEDEGVLKDLLEQLKEGVPFGKQFPFRYWAAYKRIEADNAVGHKALLLDALQECMDIACDNMPHLKGRTMCLSDNSGSAWTAMPSEYGTVKIAEIDNLSSLITARNADEGYIGLFGDKLKVLPASKRDGLLSQAKTAADKGRQVGWSTENGIWLFFRNAIEKKEHWDNIFIYSDQQAGHGGLYGTDSEIPKYRKAGFGAGRYVDVAKLIAEYRSKVNPKVNVFSIQTAGYTNAVIPEYGYRTNILYGWTGKELQFADTMIRFWDEKEKSN